MVHESPAPDSTTMASTKPTSKILDVVFLLDITGSMDSEISAMKKMITDFTESASSDTSLRIHVWTFTELNDQCYVSKTPSTFSPAELVEYVNKIKLSHPPDFPNIMAYGGDGPENCLAAVSGLMDEFTEQDNVLAFIITDNSPHHRAFGPSAEAQAEQRWLRQQNPNLPTDVFQRLDVVIETLNVSFVPILTSHGRCCSWFMQAAMLTDGVCLSPKSGNRNTTALANGLVTLMRAMQRSVMEWTVDRSEMQSAVDVCAQVFDVLTVDDPDNWIPFEEDPPFEHELERIYKKADDSETVKAHLFGLMETTLDRFAGKRGGKRCRTVDPKLVVAAVRVFVLAMLVQTGLAEDLHRDGLEKARKELVEQLQRNLETGTREIRHLNDLLTRIASAEKVAPSTTEVQCMVTLESAWETLTGLEQLPTSETDVQAWMQIVLQLSLCRLLEVKYPLDIYGKPDFMDAWSAVITDFSWGTTLSAFAAAKLRDESEDTTYRDPTSRGIFNSALLLAHPDDTVLSACYTTLSALPSLQGLVQGYLTSGGLKVFPSLTAGLQASALLAMLRQKALAGDEAIKPVEHEWLRSLLWSLRTSAVQPGFDVVKSLKSESGELNPIDNMSKLLAGFIGYVKDQEGSDNDKEIKKRWKFLFEELSADNVAFAIKRGLEDRIPSEKDIVECFVCNPEDFDPCKQLHAVEEFDAKKAIQETERVEKLRNLAGRCAALAVCKRIINLFWNLLHRDDIPFILTEDDMLDTFTTSLLLRKRTGRYNLDADTKIWARRATVDLSAPLNDLIKSFYRPQIGTWVMARQDHAHGNLMKQAAALAGESEEEYDNLLSTTTFQLLGKTYHLSRNDVPLLLTFIPASKMATFGAAAIRGKWTTQPPSQLRRHAMSILEQFSSHKQLQIEIKSVLMARPECLRVTGVNRHGHSLGNQFPGFTNWSQEYHDKRLAAKPRHKERLEKMKGYHLWMEKTKAEVAEMQKSALKVLADTVMNLPEHGVEGQVCMAACDNLVRKWKEGEGADLEEKAVALLVDLKAVRWVPKVMKVAEW